MIKKLRFLSMTWFAIFALFSVSAFSQPASATTLPSEMSAYKTYDYVIDKYDINMIVNENNSIDIAETIIAYFNVPKHGIYRTIPLSNEVVRLDGFSSKNHVKISSLSVNAPYTTSRENGNYKIKIGSSDETLTGKQTYVIKYNYNLGKDPSPKYDELYYNIIGTGWDTVIGNVTFSITMPKDFDAKKVGFSTGTFGTVGSENVVYNVVGNKITGNYDGVLTPGEALTIRVELPEGYFVKDSSGVSYWVYFVYLLPVVFLAISLFFWYKFGRDDPVVETVEFYPPAGFNSLDVGFLYKGRADNVDVTSLLVYLADKGYLKIAETEVKMLFLKSKGFLITKLKEYDGNDDNERLFMAGLFAKKDAVTASDLYNKFYITMNEILSQVNTKENKDKIFEKSASSKSIFIFLMIIASWILITLPPMLAYGDFELIPVALLFPSAGFTVMYLMVFAVPDRVSVNERYNKQGIFSIVFGLAFGIMFGGIPWLGVVLPALLENPVYLIGYMVGVACIIGMMICYKFLPKRTPYGNEMLGKISGFKNFLETAEKAKLEALVLQDPSYFYNILPYTYVLGVSDKWIEKFEAISLQAPDWYDSSTAFDVGVFGGVMSQTMDSARNAMASSPDSSSGGGGGGSSGGGSGGGGGGSW